MPNNQSNNPRESVIQASAAWGRVITRVHQQGVPNMPLSASAQKRCDCCKIALTTESGGATSFTGSCSNCREKRCKLCCTCYQCNGCTQRNRHNDRNAAAVFHSRSETPRCSSCRNCLSIEASGYVGTCQCRECAGCHNRRSGDTFCHTAGCNRSRYCCTCACDTGWEMTDPGKITFHSGRRQGVKGRKLSQRFISLEVETASIEQAGPWFMDAVRKWGTAVVPDGSVDLFELNTAPASGTKFIEQMTDFANAFEKHGIQADSSCGMHCHTDARDFNFYDVRRMTLIWRMVENGLYAIVHPKRRTNTYCIPCGTRYAETMEQGKVPKDVKHQFYLAAYKKEPGKELNRSILRREKYNDQRYNVLNMHSWMHRGTFENRMHHGTVMLEKMVNWGLLNAALVDKALCLSEKDLYAMWKPRPGLREPSIEDSIKLLLGLIDDNVLRDYFEKRYAELKPLHERDDYEYMSHDP